MKRGYSTQWGDTATELVVAKPKRVYATRTVVRRPVARRGYYARAPLAFQRAPLATRGFFPQGTGAAKELKTIDSLEVRINPTASLNAPTLALLNGVATGDDFNSRDGRQILLKSIYFQCEVHPYGNTMSNGDVVRVMIIQDSQPNGAIFTTADMFSTTSATYSSVAVNNLNNRSRFKVLMDKKIALDGAVYAASVLTGGNPSTRQFKRFIKCNIITQYSGTGATIASISTNSLYLLVMSDNSLCDFRSSTRVRFQDM